MTSSDDRSRRERKPAAFRLDDARVRMSAEEDLQPTLSGEARIVPTREGEIAGLPAPERKRGIRWGRWFAAGLGGLASLAVGLSVDALIRDLFARND